MKNIIVVITLMLSIISTDLFAQRNTDIERSKEYPLVSRFKGSIIEWYQVKNFDRYFMLTLKGNTIYNYEINGKITRIQFSSQPEHSVYEIFKSYELALKNGGFEILVTLDRRNCGVNLSEYLYIGEFNGLNALPAGKSLKPDFKEGEFAYLSAKKRVGDKEIYIVVYITNWHYPLITFDAIEVQLMAEGLVSVKDMATKISTDGHVAIYGINFNTGESKIKSSSTEAMKNIAQYLNANKSTHYIIVGHTDNTGNFESNIKLSKERAEAVKKELIGKYGVDEKQLKTYGVGSCSPISTNATQKGRAKNRRVEIVKL